MRNVNIRCAENLPVTICFSLVLLCPLMMTRAQERNLRHRSANFPTPTNKVKTPVLQDKRNRKVTITGKRINQATLPAAAIKTISNDQRFSRFLRVTDNSIAAAQGYMLVQLKNGVVAVTNDSGGGSSQRPTLRYDVASKMVKSLLSGVVLEIHICSCGNADDTCHFEKTQYGSGTDWTKCQGGDCCAMTCMRVDQYGNVYDCQSASL